MKGYKFFIYLFLTILIFSTGCLKKQYNNDIGEANPLSYKPLEKRLLESEEKLSVAEELSNMHPEEQSKHTIERKIEEAKKNIIEQEEKRLQKRIKKEQKKLKKRTRKKELDFEVENLTGKTKYIACFSYVKQADFTRWHWDKSPVYKLEDGQKITIDIDTVPEALDREHVYGYLGVFDSKEIAEKSTYELLPDKNKIDLGRIIRIKGKTAIVGIEKYGFKKEILDFKLVGEIEKRIPELDFIVENKTGRPLWVTCFIYQKKTDLPVWSYDKTPVKLIQPNEMVIIDVDTIEEKYDRVYLRGILAVFDETEEKLAKEITYELLPENNKIELYRLMMLRNKKVVLEAEKYGIIGDMIEFDIKPVRKIDFKKSASK